MSTGKTTYLGLHRWEPDDDFLRAEFNENSDKLDEELQTMQREMDSEFSAVRDEFAAGLSAVRGELDTEISAVETALSGKAPSSHSHDYAASSHSHAAGNITSGTLGVARGGTGVTSLTALMTALGGAKIQTGSYTGTGTYGSGSPSRLTFSFAPKFVFVTSAAAKSSAHTDSFLWLMGGTQVFNQAFACAVTATLSGNTLSWYCAQNAASQCNTSGVVYHYIAFG